MRWTSHPFTPDEAQAVAAWAYPPPLDAYYNDLEEDELLSGDYRAAYLGSELTGFFCTGGSAKVSSAQSVYAAHPMDIDLGLGLRPDCVGKGLGLALVEHTLEHIGSAQPVRLAVYEWNARARHVYERAGFQTLALCGEFVVMRRPGFAWQDATQPLTEGIATYPDDPPFIRRQFLHASQCGYDGTHISMTVHTGTHLDAPLHVALPGSVDAWPLERLMNTVQLLDMSAGQGAIDGDALSQVTGSRILLRTMGASAPEGRFLTPRAAEWLVSRGTQLLGIDSLSVGAEGSDGLRVHRALLGSGITIVENLALNAFSAGWYDMCCLPLRIPNCDGAPAHVLLRRL